MADIMKLDITKYDYEVIGNYPVEIREIVEMYNRKQGDTWSTLTVVLDEEKLWAFDPDNGREVSNIRFRFNYNKRFESTVWENVTIEFAHLVLFENEWYTNAKNTRLLERLEEIRDIEDAGTWTFYMRGNDFHAGKMVVEFAHPSNIGFRIDYYSPDVLRAGWSAITAMLNGRDMLSDMDELNNI